MATNASVGIVTPQKIPFDTPLALENGKTLPRFDLMIETYGTLNADKSKCRPYLPRPVRQSSRCRQAQCEDKYAGWVG